MNNKQLIKQETKQPAMFKGVTREHYREILGCGSRKIIQPKEILFHDGDTAENCYLVVNGSLKLTKFTTQGKEIIIRYIAPAEMTALVAVLEEKKFPATAISLKQTEVISWDKRTMLRLMRQNSDIAINMLNIVLNRINDLQNRYMELSSEMVERRIACTIMRLMRQSGRDSSEGVCIDIPLSRQNIADYCGASLYTVSRMLTGWEKQGWIKSGREQVTITAPGAIVKIAGNNTSPIISLESVNA